MSCLEKGKKAQGPGGDGSVHCVHLCIRAGEVLGPSVRVGWDGDVCVVRRGPCEGPRGKEGIG